jgi:hypothetical protein
MSLSSWIFVFKHSKFPCGGNLLFNLDGWKVKVCSAQNWNFCAMWDFIPNWLILDLVPCHNLITRIKRRIRCALNIFFWPVLMFRHLLGVASFKIWSEITVFLILTFIVIT